MVFPADGRLPETNTIETAVKSALNQIQKKKYYTELLNRGVKTFKQLAIVFKGKDVTIRESKDRKK